MLYTLKNIPLVSVLMPVYNSEEYIYDAISSILNQSYTKFEFIIINDGSTDKSLEIINCFRDNRIKLFTNETNKGLIFSLNFGISKCAGKYIARMDSDDISCFNRLEKQVKFLENNPDIIILGTSVKYLNNPSKKVNLENILTHEQIKVNLLTKTCFFHPTVMLRGEILYNNKNLRYDSSKVHVEDYDFWIKLLNYGQLANLNQPLLKYRIHDENISIKHYDTQKEKSFEIKKAYLNEILIKELNIDELNQLTRFFDCSLQLTTIIELERLTELLKKVIIRESNPHLISRIKELYFYSLSTSTHLGMPILKIFFINKSLSKPTNIFYILSLFIKSLFSYSK